MTDHIQIPMHDSDGQPWIAESEAEAFQLSCQGYSRDDVAAPTPATEGAPTATGDGRTTRAPRPVPAARPDSTGASGDARDA